MENRTANMSLPELVDYWTGYACLEIGRGKFRDAVSLMLQSTIQDAYARGVADTKKTMVK